VDQVQGLPVALDLFFGTISGPYVAEHERSKSVVWNGHTFDAIRRFCAMNQRRLTQRLDEYLGPSVKRQSPGAPPLNNEADKRAPASVPRACSLSQCSTELPWERRIEGQVIGVTKQFTAIVGRDGEWFIARAGHEPAQISSLFRKRQIANRSMITVKSNA